MLLDTLMAIGLLLSSASQLRPDGAPIGPGETILALWVLLMLGREAGRLGPPLTRPVVMLLAFWAVFTVAQCLGLMTAFIIGDRHDSFLFLHDVLAYPLLMLASCLSVVEPDARRRLRRIAWMLVSIGSALLVLQVGKAWGTIDILPIDPWYWDRFRGWSKNPNQLALLCAVLGLLCLHLCETAASFHQRIAAIICAIPAIYVGRLTKSDTFAIILVASGPIFIALKLRGWASAAGHGLTLRSAAAWIIIFAVPLVLITAVVLINSIAIEAKDVAKEMAKGNDAQTQQTAAVRFAAWSEAIDRGMESGMLGLGPGPHLKIPFQIVVGRQSTTDEPKFVDDHPRLGPVPNFEAHNTLFDLFTQAGLLGVASVVGLVAAALWSAYRRRLDGLVTLLCGLTGFAMFHLIIRHPIVWFAIAICLVEGHAVHRLSPARARS